MAKSISMSAWAPRNERAYVSVTASARDKALASPTVTDERTRARFWSKVSGSEGDGCWLWTAGSDYAGYGTFDLGGTNVGAHRLSLTWAMGRPLGAGLCALHRCDVPRCARPDHLWEGTKRDNGADMSAKGRQFTTNYGPYWQRKLLRDRGVSQ